MDTTEILGGFEQVGIAMSSVVCLEIYYLLIQVAYTAPKLYDVSCISCSLCIYVCYLLLLAIFMS
jgi:ferredoxin